MVKAKQSATSSTSAAPRPPASQKLVLMNYNTSASSSILPRMFSALQSSAIMIDGFPQSKSPCIAEDLADVFNPSSRWGNLAQNLLAPYHRYTCGEMVCQLQNPEDYLWQGFMDDASMPYDEQMADELDFNLANAFPEPDSISNSEQEVIDENDEVRRLNLVKMKMMKLEGFNLSFCNKETKSKDFGCVAAKKKCSCKVKNCRNKFDKKYKVACRTCKLTKEERKKVRCNICQKEGHTALACPKRKKHFGNAVLTDKYEYEVVYCNRFEKHDIPIFEYMQYESEEDETSDSTSFESTTEAVSTFSNDTSSVMFNMVCKPYAFLKKAKVTAEYSSSSSPTTTSGSEESKPSWMKKRRPSTSNLYKKEKRDYGPLPLFSNMVEQAEEIAKTEEWRRMIHLGLRQNSGNLPSPVIQQIASTDFSIPKTSAKPSPSVAKKQSVKEIQDRYCTEEHQLKAIHAMFSALEQVNNRIEQLHKLVLNIQSQLAAIEAKVDQCHGELQYLIDKATMSKIAKEPLSEWKLQRSVNTCQGNPPRPKSKFTVSDLTLEASMPYVAPCTKIELAALIFAELHQFSQIMIRLPIEKIGRLKFGTMRHDGRSYSSPHVTA
ncbi:hypothetical protein L7F22_012793 [Adiantum nelumboides]|nr:hypothetical protein [Adiantum nelumboides]